MPTPKKLTAIFYPEAYYHIVCKSIDGLLLFASAYDYKTFQERFKKFMGDFLDVWSFCFIPNHAHLIVKLKSIQSINLFIETLVVENRTKAMELFYINNEENPFYNDMIERQINSFLSSYANYVSAHYNRKGGTFQRPFKRILIEEEAHLQQAIIYVNANAQKHNMVVDYKEYRYSSYNKTLQKDQYNLDANSVLEFFGGIEKFIEIHELQVAYFYAKNWPSSKLE